MSVDRREFIERLAGGAVMYGGLTGPLVSSPLRFPVSSDDTWDLSWVSRIHGSHRAVFDCTEIESGAGLLRAEIWRLQYEQVLKLPTSEMTAVVILRHSAIPLAMTQEYWDRYKIGETKDVTDPFTEKPTRRNPILLRADNGELPPGFANANLDGVLRGGGVVLACNLAFNECISTVAKADKLDPAEAKKRAITMINPGVVLQPSGVFAAIRAQQEGCHYIKAS